MSAQIPDIVGTDEIHARYVVNKRHIRGSGAEATIKPDAYIPYKWVDLSVTRHLGLSENEIWSHGADVAKARALTLLGRGDSGTAAFRSEGLRVLADPIEGNENHANVVDWPPEKESQKLKAIEIVKNVKFVLPPKS